MEYIVNKENRKHKLSDEEKNNIAKRIVSDFTSYNDSRSENLTQAKKLIKEIFFKTDLSEIFPELFKPRLFGVIENS